MQTTQPLQVPAVQTSSFHSHDYREYNRGKYIQHCRGRERGGCRESECLYEFLSGVGVKIEEIFGIWNPRGVCSWS